MATLTSSPPFSLATNGRYFGLGGDDAQDFDFGETTGVRPDNLPAYTGFASPPYLIARGVNGLNDDRAATLDFPLVSIDGVTSVVISGEFASSAVVEADDSVEVQIRVDTSPFITVLRFVERDGQLQLDVDLDGFADADGVVLALAAVQVSSASVPVSGSQLLIRLRIALNAATEDVAVDSVTAMAESSSQPSKQDESNAGVGAIPCQGSVWHVFLALPLMQAIAGGTLGAVAALALVALAIVLLQRKAAVAADVSGRATVAFSNPACALVAVRCRWRVSHQLLNLILFCRRCHGGADGGGRVWP